MPNPIIAGGVGRRIFINGVEYGHGSDSGTALVDFVLIARDPDNEPLLENSVIRMTDPDGNVTVLRLGGRQIRVVKGEWAIHVSCEDVGEHRETRTIDEDVEIEILLGIFRLDGSWGFPRSLDEFDVLWSNQAQGVAIWNFPPKAPALDDFGSWKRSLDEFDVLWSNQAQGVAIWDFPPKAPPLSDFGSWKRSLDEFDVLWSNQAQGVAIWDFPPKAPPLSDFGSWKRSLDEFDVLWSNQAQAVVP